MKKEREIFDEKCKVCKTLMEEVDSPSSGDCYGIYYSYHCSNCGTYLHFYDSSSFSLNISDRDWIVPELAKQLQNSEKKD